MVREKKRMICKVVQQLPKTNTPMKVFCIADSLCDSEQHFSHKHALILYADKTASIETQC